MTEKKAREIREDILRYSQISSEDKLRWLYDCLVFNNTGFTPEEQEKRRKIAEKLKKA